MKVPKSENLIGYVMTRYLDITRKYPVSIKKHLFIPMRKSLMMMMMINPYLMLGNFE